MSDPRQPRDNIVRALYPAAELRSADGEKPTMVGHFARFNEWTKIDSAYEGTFMERIAPGAFARTFTNGSDIKVLFQHGKDPQVGDQVIGSIQSLTEDRDGAAYEVELFDGLPPLVMAGLKSNAYGASFRFRVVKEEVKQNPARSTSNPEGLPERTIREAQVFEFGPVTFPAYAGATAAVRSMTDEFMFERLIADPSRLKALVERTLPNVELAAEPHFGEGTRSEPPPIEAPTVTTQDPPDGGSSDSRSSTVDFQTIEEVRARYDELNETVERLADTFPLPEVEQVTFDTSRTERDRLGAEIKAYETRQAAVIRNAAKTAAVEPAYIAPADRNVIRTKSQSELHSPESRATTFEGRAAEYRDDALRLLEKTTFPRELADEARSADKIADLLERHDSADAELARRVKYTSSPTYLKAFEKIIKAKGSTIGLTQEELRGTALAVGVDATGGFAVPFAFDPTIIAIGAWSGAVNPYRRVCRVVNIVGTDTWNAITSTAVTATRTTEAAPSIEQGPTLAQPQYIVKRAQGQITASFEMFQDRTDLASEMAVLIAEAKDNEEETSWATGAGSGSASIGVGPVNGTSGAYTSITTATSVTLAAADADATEAALPVRHRFGAQWFLNRTSIRRFQTLETAGGKLFNGAQYQAVGVPELDRAGNTGLRLLGYPVNESPSLPTAQTANIVIGTLLNPNSYVIVERVGLSVQFIPFIFNSSALATGQQALYFLYRNHAAPLNVDGGRTLRYLT